MKESIKKKTGRPASKDKRQKHILARLTVDEYVVVSKQCNDLGLSHSDFIRRKILPKNNNDIVNGKELLKGLDALGTELGHSGNNINQLAKHANSFAKTGIQDPMITKTFNDIMAQYVALQSKLENAFRSILREMGKK